MALSTFSQLFECDTIKPLFLFHFKSLLVYFNFVAAMTWVANSIIMLSLTDYRSMPAARASFGKPELPQRILFGRFEI